jgi:hypothetical protein
MSVVEIRMLCWIYDHRRREQIRNDHILDKLGVAPIQEGWFNIIYDGLVISNEGLLRYQYAVDSK